ncbi:metalloprotease [Cladochytrium replicatum]|nr:metalloprotease [Cladochytrium replicatum]
MKFTLAFALGLLSISAASAARTCATEDRSPSKIAAKQAEFLKKIEPLRINADADVQIPVIFNVVHIGSTYAQGYLTDEEVKSQVDVLNSDYKGTGFQFYLANITRTINANWYNSADPNTNIQNQMKEALRQGTEATLNVYTVAFNSYPGLLGYATFPDSYVDEPFDDGVVIQWRTLPGGTYTPFDLGRTLTHEVGHWMGLYHTFQGGCAAPGDSVSDTAPEASHASGCPKGRDTCTSDKLLDPIENYMDYSDDGCMDTFTAGQSARMVQMWAAYRQSGYYPPGTPTPPSPPRPSPVPCPHDVCTTGKPLTSECGDCAAQIIAADPFCGSNSWDSICVSEVASVCGLSC